MLNIKRVFALCLSLVMVILTVGGMSAFAAPVIDAKAYFSAEHDGFIIEGTVTDTEADNVSIMIYRPGYTMDMVESGEAEITEALSNASVEPIIKGSFSYTCKAGADDTTGYYTVYINYGGTDLAVIENVYYAIPKDVAIAVEMINAITGTPEEKLEIFNDSLEYFGKLPDVYEMLSETQKAEVVDAATQKNDYTTIPEFMSAIEKYSIDKLVLDPEDKDVVAFVIENYNDVAGYDLENPFYEKYVKGYSDRIDAVCEYTAEQAPFDTIEDAKDAFQKGVIVQSLNHLGSKGEIYNNTQNTIAILTDSANLELLSGINMQGFKNLTDYKQDVMLTSFYQNKKHIVNSLEEFITNWNKAVESAAQIGNDGGSGVGGSGSGGPITNNPVDITPTTPGNSGITGQPHDNSNDNSPVFSDLSSVPWAEESITALYKAGIVDGKDANNFAPNDNITREEFLKMMMLCANITINTEAQTTFVDVNKGDWYYDIVASAQELGLVNGVSNVSFGVGENITRQDMSVMIVRLVSSLGIQLNLSSDNSKFADDNEIADYANVSVYTMKRAGIINGYEDGSFEPNAYATRAEAAKIIYALCSLMVD